MIDHHGDYWSCGDMIHNGDHLLSRDIIAEMKQAIERQDVEFILEAVHAMPKQGVSSTFKFGMAFGGAIAIIERFSKTSHMVTPQKWKKDMKLTSDKAQSLSMARDLWPLAPLHRAKDGGRAEALLMAEWYRRQND
jgi:crossover junction endodeoxyribonuclease RuvC